jgi:hypothetical protein
MSLRASFASAVHEERPLRPSLGRAVPDEAISVFPLPTPINNCDLRPNVIVRQLVG